MKTDVLIVGCGCSGLFCALNLPRELNITVITKSTTERNDSFLAQGGICVLRDENDFDSFFEDTLKAGHYENDRKSVEIMINSSREVINQLVSLGVEFDREENGEYAYTKEGAHSRARILYHKDMTGKEITSLTQKAGTDATVKVPGVTDDKTAQVTWKSSNPKVAAVDENGKITMLTAGVGTGVGVAVGTGVGVATGV